MPIYRYRCESCGHVDEVLAKISDPPPEHCTECGEGPMAKAVARTSFQLKGGGWYAEGYGAGKAGKKKPASEGKSDSTKSATSTSGDTAASAASSSSSAD